MTARRLVVVTAGLSRPSSTRLLADRLSAASLTALHDVGQQGSAALIELREHASAITNSMLTGVPNSDLKAAIASIVEADGLIAVSPIFNASFSGLFKSFFDVLEADALNGKPVLVAATGGTERHSLALEHAMRPLFAYLRALVVPTGVYAAASDWGRGETGDAPLSRRIERAARELADLVRASRPVAVADPFDDVVPFQRLLVGD